MTRLLAPAKLTLHLRVTGVRDDGYHLIDAEMVTLDLHDVLHVTAPADRAAGARDELQVSGPFADGVPAGGDNLIRRALALTGRTAIVRVDKRIPHGGGLGGGSADAAAILRWAGHPTDPDGLRRAASIGADVAFCLIGGRARVTGIGEVVEPLPHVDRQVTLVIPPVRVATPAVYRAWDDLGGPTAAGPNDLEPAAIEVAPVLARWRARIAEASGAEPVLAGSGATWFVNGEHSDALAALGSDGALVVAARTVPSSFAP